MEEKVVTRLPLYVVALHRFARLGKASFYSPTKRYVRFTIDDVLAEKWPGVRNFELVSIIYSDRKGESHTYVM